MTAPNLPSAQVIASDQPTWASPLKPSGCPACKQVFLVPEGKAVIVCPNCAKAQLSPQPAVMRPEPPELLLSFQKAAGSLLPVFKSFVKAVWLRPDDFNEKTLLERCVPVFVPIWLVDASLCGSWEAEVGYDYQVESSQDSYQGGRWVARKVVETRVRYEPRAGTIERRYDNAAVAALRDHGRLISTVGDFQYNQARRFERAQIGGALIQVPDLSPESAWPSARDRLDRNAVADCVKASGAQHVRTSAIKLSYTSLNWTQMLLPLYATYYHDDEGIPHTILINGQTGQIGGARLASQRKGWKVAGISAGVGALLFLLALLLFALSAGSPALSAIGTVLVLLALGLGLFAVVPVVWPWQWNRKQAPSPAQTK